MSDPIFRSYDPDRDRDAVVRLWREVGWIESKEHEKATDVFLEANANRVATVNDSVESHVATGPGRLQYLDQDLPLSCVTTVMTSRVARRLGLARRLLARALAEDLRRGALVTVLGMFDQGFYDALGFGTGTREISHSFDPSSLRVTAAPSVPERLTRDDWEAVHSSRLARRRIHGAVNLARAAMTRAEMLWSESGFGFGYRDPSGQLTHHVWLATKDVENGPYSVWWMAFRTQEQLMDLLSILRSWGDQVPLVRLSEPPGVHFQDLLQRPFRARLQTKDGKYAVRTTSGAYWQARILDLEACLAQTRLDTGEVRFSLTLHDPIEAYLPDDEPWRGLSGEYTVTLGPHSAVEHGARSDLPRLRATIGAFTRLWLGVLPATSLAWTDDLQGPEELLVNLDRALRLPPPHPDWEF
jgi:predicted acetyltransferase